MYPADTFQKFKLRRILAAFQIKSHKECCLFSPLSHLIATHREERSYNNPIESQPSIKEQYVCTCALNNSDTEKLLFS